MPQFCHALKIFRAIRRRARPQLWTVLAFSLPLLSCVSSKPSAPPPAAPAPQSPTKIVMGYYLAGRGNVLDHTKIKYEYLTHISHAFTKPDARGNLVVNDNYLDPGLIEEAHRRKVKVIMSIGGWGNCEGFPGMAATPENRSRFIGQVLDFLRANHYDGVDIDWEFVSNPAEKTNFTSFIKELSAALKAENPPLLLSMAAPSSDYWGKWIDYEELADYFDFIGFMTYDFHGEWTDHSGHNSPLYSCGGDECGSVHGSALYGLSRGIPKEKLVLGLAFFGRSFDCGGLYRKFKTSIYYGYNEVLDLLSAGWSYHWDECAQVPFVLKPDKSVIVCYDDEKSIGLKCSYVRDKGLGGVIIWEITHDEVKEGSPVLLKEVAEAFKKSGS